jgi:hypothetical protein
MIIEEFNMETLKPDGTYLIIGANLCGKTTIVRDIILANRHIFGTVGTYIASTYESGKRIVESDLGHDKVIYLNNPTTYMETIKTEIIDAISTPSSSYICMDNILFSHTWQTDPVFVELLKYGEINKTTTILSFDHVPKISDENKTEIDYTFISNGLDFEEIDEIYDKYVKKLTFSEFLSLYSLLEPYDFIVIENGFNMIKYHVYNSTGNSLLTSTNRRPITDKVIRDEDILSGKIKIGVSI